MYNICNCIDLNLGGKSKTNKRIAEYKNNVAFNNALNRLALKGIRSLPKIKNIPDTMNPRVIDMARFFHASLVFFEKDGSNLALPGVPNSNLNLYGDFKSAFVYGRNGFNEQVPLYIPGADEAGLLRKGYITLNNTFKARGVYFRENEDVYPLVNYAIDYAEKIADCMRTIDVIRSNIKRPFVVTCEEQLVPTVKKFFEERDKNIEYIVSTGVFPADKVAIIPIETNAEAIKVATDLIEWYYNDFDNVLLYNSNGNPDKKERLLVDEVNANNESTKNERKQYIEYLKKQIEFVNDCLGTDMYIEEEVENDDAIQGLGINGGYGSLGSGSGNGSDD